LRGSLLRVSTVCTSELTTVDAALNSWSVSQLLACFLVFALALLGGSVMLMLTVEPGKRQNECGGVTASSS
jgi:hypothetical protein